jgi:hypothetical protein
VWRSPLRLLAPLALALASCKSAELRESERLMPAVEALAATVPSGDPKDFVRTAPAYEDTLRKLEASLRDGPHPPPGTPAAQRLGPATAWAQAARAEDTAIEDGFKKVLAPLDPAAHTDLAAAVTGGPTHDPSEMAAALATTTARPLVLWHGTGDTRGFDEDHQRLGDRRATDPEARFVVGYVQRVQSEALRFVVENVIAQQEIAYVALYVMPARHKLGVFAVRGDVPPLPSPPPPAFTTLQGKKPAVVESLLGR